MRIFLTVPLCLIVSIGLSDDIDSPVLDDAALDRGTWTSQVSDRNVPLVSTMTRASNRVYEQDTEVLVPLFSNEDGSQFIFSSLSYNYRDVGNAQFSGGLYYRFAVPDLNAILGFSVHGDTTDTDYDNQIDQFGLGFDVFTESGIDFNLNLYFSEDDRHLIGSTFGDPYAQGFSIMQDRFGTYEQGLSGGDLRVSFPVPLINRILPSRGYVGGYAYDGDLAPDVDGFIAGVDVFPFQGVVIGTEYFGDEEFYGNHWVFKGGVTIPVDNIFRPQDWGRGLRQVFGGTAWDRNDLAVRSRLASPRRNFVLTETAANPVAYQSDVIQDDIVFANSGGNVENGIRRGRANGSGRAEDPTDTIQRGANVIARRFKGKGTVYVQGDRNYNETVMVGNTSKTAKVSRLQFISSFKPIMANGGLLFGGETARPVVNGGFVFRGGSGLNSVEVNGFEIVGGNSVDGHGISSDGVAKFIATCNIIRDTVTDGINVQNLGGGNAWTMITDNRILNSTRDAVEIDHRILAGKKSEIVVSDNRIENSSDGAEIEVETFGGSASVEVSGNDIMSSRDQGIDLSVVLNTGSTGDVKVMGNTVKTTVTEGIFVGLEANGRSQGMLEMSGNDQSGSGFSGSYVYIEATDGSSITGEISDNTFQKNTFGGLDVIDNSASGGSNIGLVITGNQFLSNGDLGLFLETDWEGGTHSVEISNNVARGNINQGFYLEVDAYGGSSTVLNMDGNLSENNTGDGAYVYFEISEGSSIVGNLRNNTFRNNSDNGLSVYDNSASGNSNVAMVITGNQFLSNGDDGLDFETDWADGGVYSVNISNNVTSGNSDDGFDIYLDNDGQTNPVPFVLSGNQFLNNGDNSLELRLVTDGATINMDGTGNVSSGAGSGLALKDDDTSSATGSIQLNGATITFPSPGDIPD